MPKGISLSRIRAAGSSNRLLVLILMLLCLILPAEPLLARQGAAGPAGFSPLETERELTDFMDILVDKNSLFSLQEAAEPARDAEYIPFSTSGLAGSITDSAYWVRLKLYNNQPMAQSVLLELSKPQLQHVRLYILDESRRLIKELETGSSLPFSLRNVQHRNFLFQLDFPAQEGRYLYFRVQTDSYLQLPMKMWQPAEFLHKEQISNLVFGFYYGIMAAMALYNFFLFISIRDRVYLHYVLFIISFTIMQAVWDGLAYQFLWPDSPGWQTRSNPVLIMLTCLFASAFTKSFLSVSTYAPRMAKAVNAFIAAIALGLGLVMILSPGAATKVAVYAAAACLILCITMIALVRFRARSVVYYMLAWLVLFLGALLNLLAAFKVLPLNFITLYGIRFGSAGETLLLSAALADRFNSIRQEKMLEERRGTLLKKLNALTQKLTSIHDLDTLLAYTLNSLSIITACENGIFLLHNERGVELKAATGAGLPEGRPPMELMQNELLHNMAEKNSILYLRDGDASALAGEGMITCIGLPINCRDRQRGLILLCSRQRIQLAANEADVLGSFAGQVGISMENALLFAEINRLACMDGLTGVYNRAHFMKQAQQILLQALQADRPLSLIMADIDHFKQINDRYGHLAGDQIISHTAKVLSRALPQEGIAGRYGGEEFILLLPGLAGPQALQLAETMRQSIASSPVAAGGMTDLGYSISLGIATLTDSQQSLTALIDQADQALYQAKAKGRNCAVMLERIEAASQVRE